jgi:hypothetical protein
VRFILGGASVVIVFQNDYDNERQNDQREVGQNERVHFLPSSGQVVRGDVPSGRRLRLRGEMILRAMVCGVGRAAVVVGIRG